MGRLRVRAFPNKLNRRVSGKSAQDMSPDRECEIHLESVSRDEMLCMNSRQISAASDSASALPRTPRAVFLVGQGSSFPPAASAAEQICQLWLPTAATSAPALVYVHPHGCAALVDHLRRRVVAAPAILAGSSLEALSQLTQSAIDEGATLIAGGQSTDCNWQVSQFVNVTSDSTLGAPHAPAGPLLAVLPGHAPSSLSELAATHGPHVVHHLDGDRVPSPTSQQEGAS